ncbi:hypothetical protein ACVWZZ_004297 [Bradyrhizobium sp. LM6.10]
MKLDKARFDATGLYLGDVCLGQTRSDRQRTLAYALLRPFRLNGPDKLFARIRHDI